MRFGRWLCAVSMMGCLMAYVGGAQQILVVDDDDNVRAVKNKK